MPNSEEVTGQTGSRLHQLDGLRAVAFLAVFAHHALGLPMGWAGVDLFFVLSGFLITGILVREKGTPGFFRTFYTRRFLRIFPPYYLFLLVALVILGEPFFRESWWYLLYLSNVRDSLMTPFTPWLSPMWSLAVEEQYYLLWPLVVAVVPRRRLIWICVVLVVLAPVLRAALTVASASFRPVYHLLLTRMDLLAAGGILALLQTIWPGVFRRVTRSGLPVAALAAVVFFICALSLPSFRTSENSMLFNTLGYSLVLVAAVGVLAGVLGPTGSLLSKVLSSRPAVFLGTISYTMYLVHKLALTATRSLTPHPWLAAVAALGLTITWATFSWYLLERPLANLKERLYAYLSH